MAAEFDFHRLILRSPIDLDVLGSGNDLRFTNHSAMTGQDFIDGKAERPCLRESVQPGSIEVGLDLNGEGDGFHWSSWNAK